MILCSRCNCCASASCLAFSSWSIASAHFGKWNTVFKRYRDWVKAGVFETIFASVNEDVDLEYAMIDGTIVKVHRHGQGAKGGLSNSL